MRRVVLIFLTLCAVSLGASAQGVKYFKGNLYDGLGEAMIRDKLLMVEFYASWSHKSRWMNEQTLSKFDLSDKFVVVRVDTSTPEGASIALTYQVNDYPNILIFNKNGSVVDRIDQALTVEDFKIRLSELSIATNPARTLQLRQIYMAVGQGDENKMNSLVADYLSSIEKSEINASLDIFTSQSINYFPSSAFKYMIANRDEFDSAFVEDRVQLGLLDAILPYVSGVKHYHADTISIIETIAKEYNCKNIIIRITRLAKLRHEGQSFEFLQELNAISGAFDPEFQYPLLLSLDFVDPKQLDRNTKRMARKLLQDFSDRTSSASKNMILRPLIEKFF